MLGELRIENVSYISCILNVEMTYNHQFISRPIEEYYFHRWEDKNFVQGQ